MNISKLLLMSCVLFLSACTFDGEDENLIADLRFNHDDLAECVQRQAEQSGWVQIDEVIKLECVTVGTPFTSDDIEALSVFNNLDFLYLGQTESTRNEFIQFDGSRFSNLTFLGCANCQFSSLNLKDNAGLKTLVFYDTTLPPVLDLSGNQQLFAFKAFNSEGGEILLGQNSQLSQFDWKGAVFDPTTGDTIARGSIKINLEVASELQSLVIYNINLAKVNISSDSLEEVNINRSGIGELEIDSNSLSVLYCIYCELDALNTEGLGAISQITVPYNHIQSIDVSSNLSLTTLDLTGNPLTDVTKNYLDSLAITVLY